MGDFAHPQDALLVDHAILNQQIDYLLPHDINHVSLPDLFQNPLAVKMAATIE